MDRIRYTLDACDLAHADALFICVQTPPMWQIALSIVLTLATVVGVTWAASRVYRVGILMYGKRPTFPEMLRWIRESGG